MSNATWFKSGRVAVVSGFAFAADLVTAILVRPEYTPDFLTHSEQGHIPADYQVAESPVTGRTITESVLLRCDDIVADLPPGVVVGGVVLIAESGEVDTSPLLVYLSGAGFPFTTDGTPVTIQVPNGLVQF